VNLWSDTPGAGFTDKFAVLLLGARVSHQQDMVKYDDAVRIAHDLDRARTTSESEQEQQ
jgi:hypothetical protein